MEGHNTMKNVITSTKVSAAIGPKGDIKLLWELKMQPYTGK